MKPAEFLNSLGLGEYVAAFEENAIDEESLRSLTDSDLKELGVAKLGHRKKILEALAAPQQSGSPAGALDELIAGLPNVVALPLREYAGEEHPVAKLWAMCDTVELLLRLVVVAFVSHQRERGGLSEKTAESLAGLVESPTLGAWFVMAQTLAKETDPTLKDAAGFVEGPLRDLLYGPEKPGTAETSLLRLRNRLAHGGGLTRREAARLLELWQPKFEKMIAALRWLADWKLAGRDKQGRWLSLAGPEPGETGFAPHSSTENVDAVWIKVGEASFPLWPLAVFGQARAPGATKQGSEDLTQIYTRRENLRLAYTPVGAEGLAQSESGPTGFEAFKALFQLDRPKRTDFTVPDFAGELRKDAAQAVGRDKETATIIEAIHRHDQGVLWISGAAGTGKSFLVAKALAEILDRGPGEQALVLAYRFRASDQTRCSREALATFLEERLKAAGAIAPGEEQDRGEDAAKRIDNCLARLKAGWNAVIFVDGLDEIARSDAKFAEEVPLGIRPPNVLWVCSGRPESGLAKAMSSLGALALFPDGLPPMSQDDIRAMMLEKIGPLRKKLLAGDKEKGDAVVNPFIDLVTQRAAGLPLYVKYVIGDVLAGKYRVLDGQEDLPESLHAYHEELLRRLAVGDLQAVVTPLVATLACAHEPLSLREITAILVHRKLLVADGAEPLVDDALAATASMLSTAPDPEGETGFTLFHQSLRDHMRGSEQMRQSMGTGIAALADLSVESDPPAALQNYLLRCGVRHLLDADRREEAQAVLLDLTHLGRMAERGVEAESVYSLWQVLGDEDRSPSYAPILRDYLAAPSAEKLVTARFVETLCAGSGWTGAHGEIAELSARSHESVLGPDDVFSIMSGASLAASLNRRGLYAQSKDLAGTLLERSRKALGFEHAQTLRCMNILAKALDSLGETEASRELLEESVRLGEQSLGPDHPVTLIAASDLALCLQQLGEFGEAETIFKRVLKTREKVFGPLHAKTLATKSLLGTLLSESGRKREAQTLLRDALAGLESERGLRHPLTLSAMTMLANQLRSDHQAEEAERLLRRSAEGAREVFGPAHHAYLGTLNDLASALTEGGKAGEAENLLRQVTRDFADRFGDESDSTLMARNNLALVLKQQGNLEEAGQILRECLETHRHSKGESHPQTLRTLNNLANLARQQGQLDEAESLYRAAASGWEKSVGSDHFKTLRVQSNLAALLAQKGQLEEACEILRHTAQCLEKLEEADSARLLENYSRLGWVLWKLQRPDEAAAFVTRAYEGRVRTLGEHDTDTLADLRFLAALTGEAGDNDNSLKLYEKLLEAKRQTAGDEDSDTLKVATRIGSLRKHSGDYDGAEKAYLLALSGYEQTAGALHPDTLQAAVNLALLYKAQDKEDEEKAVYLKYVPAEAELGNEINPTQAKFLNTMRKRLRELQAA